MILYRDVPYIRNSIYKEKDGPLTAFKSFGEDIKKTKSVDATSKI